jgi:hypothetical protein
MSPVEYINARQERQRLARLRRVIGVTGLELPDDGRPGAAPAIVLLGVLGIGAGLVLGFALAGAL